MEAIPGPTVEVPAVEVPAVTAAVVVKDRRVLVERCVRGLWAQQGPAGPGPGPAGAVPACGAGPWYEIVVVDNGSTDGTREYLEQAAQESPVPLRVIVDHGSLGRIRNRAVSEARAPVVAFVDSDCAPEPRWLARGLAALTSEPRRGVVQGRTVPDPTTTLGRWPATQDLASFTHRYEACNIFYRVGALEGAGGFDERIGFFGEDTAAGWAVRRAGWDAAFEPDAVVVHAVTHPGVGWHLRRAWGYGNINALVGRYPEMRDVLWNRVFLRPSSAAFAAAAAGVALSPLSRRALLLALPYLWLRRPRGRHPTDLLDAMGGVAFDGTVFAALVGGSIRHRSLVL